MPSNIEIKARLRNRAHVESLAASISQHGPELLHQEDHFFPCEGARLKLRILGAHGELIRYQRTDAAQVRRSRYKIARTSDPHALLEILTQTLGTTGVVKKERTLYLIGQTRVHLDRVSGLGDFLELEVVLQPGQSEAEGKQIAEHLLSHFAIANDDLIAKAYIDLLSESARTR